MEKQYVYYVIITNYYSAIMSSVYGKISMQSLAQPSPGLWL